MPRQIDYYFSLNSPWAYIGHPVFMGVVARHQAKVNYKPVLLPSVFAETGGLPLPKRHPARQRYRIRELQRWREKRGLKFNLHPKFWPFDVNIPDRFVIAIVLGGHNPDEFLRGAFATVWEAEQNLADPATLVALADALGLPGATLIEAAKGEQTQSIYAQTVHEAIAADVIGSPCYVLDGEVFWGQDRLELLDDALASGRAPYRADA